MTARRFTGAPAVRASVPLQVAVYGPSGSGKTYSLLRLATGIKSICGGKIGVADTENKRATHYAGEFDFIHYDFQPPFDPLSYLAIAEQMHADGITIGIIDSGSHEHDGTGGVLEMHEREIDRLSGGNDNKRQKVQMLAWAKPKADHRRMIQGMLRLPMHILWAFRAKEKLEIVQGQNPKKLGFMPIASDDLVYEMAMTALLMPGAMGVPTWASQEVGEKMMIKLPHWARAMLRSGTPLDEELGAALAKWAQGDAVSGDRSSEVDKFVYSIDGAKDEAQLDALLAHGRRLWRSSGETDQQRIKIAIDDARERMAAYARLLAEAEEDAEADAAAARLEAAQ